MPTKEIKRHARGIVEALETRAHAGPPVAPNEIRSAREFLEQHDFSSASDYFSRLARLQQVVQTRPVGVRPAKRNYGGESTGCWMQLQSVYDHVIISTCHDGEFNSRRGRIKMSHRFNQAGRIEFVELKFLRSLEPTLDGAIRKLITVCDYQNVQRDWFETEAFVLRVLPRELIFLHRDLFRAPRLDLVAWLINIGHRAVADLLVELRAGRVNGHDPDAAPNPNQAHLTEVHSDPVAMPILEQAASLESVAEVNDEESVLLRYSHKW